MSNPIPSDSFEAVLQAPEIIFDPGAKYAASTRKFQGISSLACGRNGRLWATWYGGITPGEDHNNYVMLAISADVGRTWSDEILVIDPDGEGPVRDFDPEVWLAPDGKLWLFWAQGYSHEKTTSSRSGVWAITATEMEAHGKRSHLTAFLSEDDGQSWPWWLLLDERLGVSYPDGDQADDGTIHITYDFDRTGAREILLATCTEDDIVQGNMHLQTVRLRTVVNKATG